MLLYVHFLNLNANKWRKVLGRNQVSIFLYPFTLSVYNNSQENTHFILTSHLVQREFN